MKISEHFFSIQGEGASVGVPAYFIRLTGCNLMCGGPNAKLMKEGKATWWCDSEAVWRNGTDVTTRQMIHSWKEQGILDRINTGNIHIVWTGGEPTMERHVDAITKFVSEYDEIYPNNLMYNEIETNGTIEVNPFFYPAYIDQINCSPKLANSGMKENIRINPAAIDQIKRASNPWFKFVISEEADIKEIQDTFILPFDIDKYKVIIMPGVDNRDDLAERTLFLFELTKKYGYRGITRQHILAWDKVTGV